MTHDELKARIASKVDVGFAKSNADMPVGWMSLCEATRSEQPNMRLEALKLAYEAAFHQTVFHWDKPEICDHLFKLAQTNYMFIATGKINLFDDDID